MLLHPFEKQFHVPALSVELCNGEPFVSEMVGEEAINIACGKVFISDHSESLGITPGSLKTCQTYDLIGNHTCSLVNLQGINDFILNIVFGSCDEERPLLMNKIEESEEIDISLIHQVYGSEFDTKMVKHIDIVYGGICEVNEYREVASEIQQGMHLDSSFGLPELCPGTELKAQTDCTAVECVDHIIQVQTKWIVSVQWPDFLYKLHPEIPVDTPIPALIGFGQCIAWNSVADAAMIQFVRDSLQTGFYITETVLIGKLCQTHNHELIVTGEIPDSIVTVISGNTFIEFASWYERHNLSKNCFSGIHYASPVGSAYKNIQFKSCTRLNPCNKLYIN